MGLEQRKDDRHSDRDYGRPHRQTLPSGACAAFRFHARGTADRWRDIDLLVVMEEVPDKRRAAVEIRRALSDLPVSIDFIVTTSEEIERRGNIVGTVLRSALRDGKIVYDRTDQRFREPAAMSL